MKNFTKSTFKSTQITSNKIIAEHYNLLILIIFLTGALLRFYGFGTQGYWFDEWTTMWHANPNFDWENFYNLRREFAPNTTEYEGTPKLYFFMLRVFFTIFGFTAENGRIFTATFSILSLIILYFLINIFSKEKKTILFVFFLNSINLFFIWEAQETRVQSVVLFFSLLNIYLFFQFLEKNNFFFYLLFALSMIFLLSLSPITMTIILSQVIYIITIIQKLKKIKIIFLLYIFSGFIYLYFNYDYLLNILQFKGYIHSNIHWHFFVGYFFNVFFGSNLLGGLFLFLFVFILVKNYKFIINNLKLRFLIITIFITYALLVIYSLRNGLMGGRYIIFLVPIIIIFIIINLENMKFKYKFYLNIFIIFFSISVLIYKIDDRPIKKPPTQKIINIIASSGILNVTTNLSTLFSNYLVTHKSFYSNKLTFLDLRHKITFPKKIWLICGNNMRADVGENHDLASPKCSSSVLDKNMKIKKNIKELDLQLTLYEQ